MGALIQRELGDQCINGYKRRLYKEVGRQLAVGAPLPTLHRIQDHVSIWLVNTNRQCPKNYLEELILLTDYKFEF